ncbi:MAG TPA: hypothetical protein ENH05_02245, partial [Rhizobiales bacterium]|nr:hypothetical protein [Hyphomicrobiales bacterium]
MSDIPASDQAVTERRDHKRGKRDRRTSERPRLGRFNFSGAASLISPRVVTGGARLIEFVLIAALGYGIFYAYVDDAPGLPEHIGQLLYIVAILAAAAVSVLSFQAFHLYDITILSSAMRQVARVWTAWTLIFAVLLAFAFFAKLGQEFSRVWAAVWYSSSLGALAVFRISLSVAVRKWAKLGRLTRRAVIVGGGPEARKLIRALEASRDTDIQIYGVFDDRSDKRVANRIAGYPKLGNIDQLTKFGREK